MAEFHGANDYLESEEDEPFEPPVVPIMMLRQEMADRQGFPVEQPTPLVPDQDGHYPFKINPELSDAEQAAVQQMLHRNLDVFAFTREQLGYTHLAKHTIDTGDHPPVFQKPYRMSAKEAQLVESEV